MSKVFLQSQLETDSLACADSSFFGPSPHCVFCPGDICQSQLSLWGCQAGCGIVCDIDTCDYTCPRREEQFVNRQHEVVADPKIKDLPLKTPVNPEHWPEYVPQLQNGSRFSIPFNLPFVAIPTFRALAISRGKPHSAASLRKAYNLGPGTQIIAVSVSKDPRIELFWRHHQSRHLIESLAEWGLTAITIPNFSFFDDAPPLHTFWNFERLLRLTERFSAAGIAVIPHVQMLEPVHRILWSRLLREQPHLHCVVKEFQTGAKVSRVGRDALRDLYLLQDESQRDLHPVIVGGTRYLNELRRHFRSFTLIDSYPFMVTINRHEIIAMPRGVVQTASHRLPEKAPLDELWQLNLSRYLAALEIRQGKLPLCPTGRESMWKTPNDQQLQFALQDGAFALPRAA